MPTQTFFDLSEEKKARILRAAYIEFADSPYDKVSIQSIIQTAKIPRGSFYQYFTDKEDLYLHCMSKLREKIMTLVFEKSGIDFYWHRIYSADTLKDSETIWFQNFSNQVYGLLDEEEARFLDSSFSAPHHVRSTSLCTDATNIYYPYFSRILEAEGIFPDSRNRDILAFFLSMGDLLTYEYSHINQVPDQKAFGLIRLGLKTLVDAYRTSDIPLFQEDEQNYFVLSRHLQAKLNALSLTSIHLLSCCGTDILLQMVPDTSWQLQQINEEPDNAAVFITVAPDITNGLITLNLQNDDMKNSTIPTLQKMNPFANALVFFLFEGKVLTSSPECYLFLNSIPYNISSTNLIGIGTKKDGTKVCLLENGKFII